MAEIRVIFRNAVPLVIGVPVVKEDGGAYRVDPLLRRIYALSLSSHLDLRDDEVLALQVPQDDVPAIKATLIEWLRESWRGYYQKIASEAGAVRQMLEAECQQVDAQCAAMIQELGFGQPHAVSVDVCSKVSTSGLRPIYVRDIVEGATMAQIASNDIAAEACPGWINPTSGHYDVTARVTLPLHGNEAQRQAFVTQCLPALMSRLQRWPTSLEHAGIMDYQPQQPSLREDMRG